jgi:hypothetical protein
MILNAFATIFPTVFASRSHFALVGMSSPSPPRVLIISRLFRCAMVCLLRVSLGFDSFMVLSFWLFGQTFRFLAGKPESVLFDLCI